MEILKHLSLYTSFHNLGNPFKEKEKNLVQIVTKVFLDSEASTSIKIAQQLGENQYNEFVRERIYDNKEPFYNILQKINYVYSNKTASRYLQKQNKRLLT